MEPITLADLIAQVESSGNPYAYRFEPTVFASLRTGAMTPVHEAIVNRIMHIHSCNQSSAQVIYSSSYGLQQIMGFDLYGELECDCSIFKFLGNPSIQNGFFLALLDKMGLKNFTPQEFADSPGSREMFGKVYNGSYAYAVGIVAALKHFGFQVAA